MPKSTSVCNSILALIYNATPWANVADNAASSPLTAIAMALATAQFAVLDEDWPEVRARLEARLAAFG